MSDARGQRGFSLIEVLAAMVIFSTGAVILFGWIGQTATRMGSLSAEQRMLFGEMTGIQFVRSLNPMQQPEGETEIGGVRIHWKATPAGDESVVRSGGGEGNYAVRLYQVQFDTRQSGSTAATERSVYLAGWRERGIVASNLPFADPRTNAPNATGSSR